MSDRILRSLRHLLSAVAVTLGFLLTLAVPDARAAFWYVRPGGGGDATTIQGGLALAQSGDFVFVSAGTYMEHDLQLPPGVSLVSQSGPDSTIIDAQGTGYGVIGADAAVVQGFTIRHAGAEAVYCYQTSPAVLYNRFLDDLSRTIVLYRSTSEIAGNEFFAYASSPSSQVVSSQSTPWIHDNVFHANDPNGNISAIEMLDVGPGGIGAARIDNNIIYGRTYISDLARTDTTRVTRNVCVVQNGFSEAFNIAFNPSPLLLQNNTIVGGSGVFLQGGSKAALLANIVVDGRYGIQAWGGVVVLDCNDVFHCETPYAGVSPGPHDFSADPRFCSSAAGDYSLYSTSPCAPARSPSGCGLVGALPVICFTITHAITATAGPGGAIFPSFTVYVSDGDDQTFTITPDPGYQVANVRVDTTYVGAVTSYTFHNVSSDHTITASFAVARVTHTITATAGPGGNIFPSGAVEVLDGANQSFLFTVADGWRLTDVLVDGVSLGPLDSYAFYNVVADHTIAVAFARIPPPPPVALEINQIRMLVTSGGSFAWDTRSGTAGLEFPKGSGKTAVFASGLWVGAVVSDSTRVTVTEYSDEFGPGAMVNGGPDDPNRPEYKIYRLDRHYASAGTRDSALGDYNAGAVPHGAPAVSVLPNGDLGIPGDQMLWHVYNDADPRRHFPFGPGGSQPLGVEVQQTAYAFNRPGALGNTAFLRFKIINKGSNLLQNLYAALWSDPDLGSFSDDLVGCDPTRSLGYCYNGTNNDAVYGSAPPAVGYDLLRVAKTGASDPAPGATAFSQYLNSGDPQNAAQSYNLLRGLLTDGAVITNPVTNQPTTYFYSGDPVAGTGWLDANPGDRRFLLPSGPFTLAAGETLEVVGAIVIGDGTDRLSSIAKLRDFDDQVQQFFADSGCQIAISLTMTPRVLGLKSRGRWVTGYLEPPAPWRADQIEVASIRLNGTVPVDPTAPVTIRDSNGNRTPDLAVKFDRAALELTLTEGAAVPVTVTGTVSGQCFTGTGTVRVLRAVVTAPPARSLVSSGATTTVRWEKPAGADVQSVSLLSTFDDGTSWQLVARDVPNSGRYDWRVPDVVTNRARVAIVLVESSGGGYLVDGVLAVSGTFSIGRVTGVASRDVPSFALRGANPNPSRGVMHVSFSLPDDRPATLGLYDVSGRQVAARRLEGVGPGWHTVDLGSRGHLPAGLYIIRLNQGGRSLIARAVVIR
ncbi:MAG TPA: hypothetical protein VGK93_03060 [Candidatus Eisenbacteria bacterium]|jgi:hypothetical protein